MRQWNAGNSMIMSRMLSFAVCRIEAKRSFDRVEDEGKSEARFDRMKELLIGDPSIHVLPVGPVQC